MFNSSYKISIQHKTINNVVLFISDPVHLSFFIFGSLRPVVLSNLNTDFEFSRIYDAIKN